jgi:hypothetical protein
MAMLAGLLNRAAFLGDSIGWQKACADKHQQGYAKPS